MAKHDGEQDLLFPSALLSLSNDSMANLLENMTDGLCLLDHDWTIRYINTRGADMLAPQRSPGSQLAGSSLWQACPDLQGTALEAQYRGTMAQQQQQSGSFELPYRPSGRWLEVRIYPSSEGWTTYIQDISERKAAEESARQGEEDVHALANSIVQLAWIANVDGTIAWVDQRWQDYTGSNAEQMASGGWSSACEAQHLAPMLQGWKTALRDGTPFDMTFPMRAADGQYRWFLTRAYPVRDRGGQLLRWFGTSTDVDQVKRAQQALRTETRMLELLNDTGASLAAPLDMPALLQETVDAATRISGARFGALYYDDARDVRDNYGALPAARAVNGISLFQADTIAAPLRQGPAMRQNDLRAAPDASTNGTPTLRSCLSLPIRSRSGMLLGHLLLGHPQAGMFNARSERIASTIAAQAGVALDNMRLHAAATRAALEHKVLCEREREARAEVEHTHQLKDDFLTTLSHELRTPLSAILGWAQVLRRGTRNQADLHRGLQSIERNARAQAQLIEDLLDMRRISADKLLLDLQPLAPASIIASTIDILRPAADAKDIAIHSSVASDAGTIIGDSFRIEQVLWNLLSNALKFTPQGGRIDIGMRREATHLAITVSDNGVGIKKDFLPHVFERFRQADAAITRRHGGLGLGLAIVKHLVEQHGGTVTASSGGDMQGASFTVRLPLDPPAAAAPQAGDTASANPDLRGVRVLLVDADAGARALTQRILRDKHAEVHGTGSVAQALQLLEQVQPHVLVSDIGMADTDGLDLLAHMRAHAAPGAASLPALALTAFAQLPQCQRALSSGFQAWVAKPLDPVTLVAAVAQLATTHIAPPLKR